MDSFDLSSEFAVPASGSRLLSESPLHVDSSTSQSVDDLSLADLSLTDRPPRNLQRRPFSLLAQPRFDDKSQDESAVADEDAEIAEGNTLDQTMTPEEAERARKLAAKTREEKLESDLFILRKLNAAFNVYHDALKETKSSTERVAEQLEHTNVLLDRYVAMLSKSEKVTKLILDERWEGAEADLAQLEQEAREEEERIRKEEEARAEAARRERERKEREEQARREKEERERLERERAESSRASSRSSGVRGVRGTRASMRGTRGIASTRREYHAMGDFHSADQRCLQSRLPQHAAQHHHCVEVILTNDATNLKAPIADSVNSLAFSPDCSYLAIGDDTGRTMVVDVLNFSKILEITWASPVTAVLWHPYDCYLLFIGHYDGRLIGHRFDVEDSKSSPVRGIDVCRDPKGPIDGLDYFGDNDRLALIARDKVALCQWSSDLRSVDEVFPPLRYFPSPPASSKLASEVSPRNVHFFHMGESLLVSYLNHGIVCFDVASQTMTWSLPLRTQIGRSALSPDEGTVMISNLAGGIDMFDVRTRMHIDTLSLPSPEERNVPLPLLFIHEGEDMLFGSATGDVQIVDATFPIVQLLVHTKCHIIQALAYCHCDDAYYIATGSSETGNETCTKVWYAGPKYLSGNDETEAPQLAVAPDIPGIRGMTADSTGHEVSRITESVQNKMNEVGNQVLWCLTL
ncbi:hypothetical protein NM688_g3502 [Phlebia brevispora]|uniref:Uncharacterized protein n=1 Tax=Phlebia brevispora TaxID=194682 RepID=A0ACC1T5K8_9APHY|nr:hypothetical protein NM688_g3502 [Phlebia brevispora]